MMIVNYTEEMIQNAKNDLISFGKEQLKKGNLSLDNDASNDKVFVLHSMVTSDDLDALYSEAYYKNEDEILDAIFNA
jgi:hypothetical protein